MSMEMVLKQVPLLNQQVTTAAGRNISSVGCFEVSFKLMRLCGNSNFIRDNMFWFLLCFKSVDYFFFFG